MEYQFIKFEAANGIGVLRFDRPEVYNALCEEMSLEIADLLADFLPREIPVIC